MKKYFRRLNLPHFISGLAGALLVSCASVPLRPVESPPAPNLESLQRLLTGTFSSVSQAIEDKDYFVIELRAVRIWAEQPGARWVYVEQATASAPDKPYRQRVYRLTQAGDQFVSQVYALPGDPLLHAGAWRNKAALAGITPAELLLREGCDVVLRWRAEPAGFIGGTQGKGCASDLRGASYATSSVTLDPLRIDSWDQGFDRTDQQVWGAIKGPYQFKRRSTTAE